MSEAVAANVAHAAKWCKTHHTNEEGVGNTTMYEQTNMDFVVLLPPYPFKSAMLFVCAGR